MEVSQIATFLMSVYHGHLKSRHSYMLIRYCYRNSSVTYHTRLPQLHFLPMLLWLLSACFSDFFFFFQIGGSINLSHCSFQMYTFTLIIFLLFPLCVQDGGSREREEQLCLCCAKLTIDNCKQHKRLSGEAQLL